MNPLCDMWCSVFGRLRTVRVVVHEHMHHRYWSMQFRNGEEHDSFCRHIGNTHTTAVTRTTLHDYFPAEHARVPQGK